MEEAMERAIKRLGELRDLNDFCLAWPDLRILMQEDSLLLLPEESRRALLTFLIEITDLSCDPSPPDGAAEQYIT